MNAYDTIVKQIEESLMADERTQDANIEVMNQRGIVTLSGMVESVGNCSGSRRHRPRAIRRD